MNVDIDPNDFIKMLYRHMPYGYVEFRLLKNEKPSYPIIRWMEMPNTLTDENIAELERYNNAGMNIYYGVTVRKERRESGGGRVSDALFTRVLWTDLDTLDKDALNRLREARPSFIVCSGGGYHGYWLLKKTLVLHGEPVPEHERDIFEAADDALLKRTLQGIGIALGADPKVAEFARILRLPGFKNTKPGRNNAVCEVIEGNLLQHDFKDLANEYAYLVKQQLKTERYVPTTVSNDLPKSVQDYLTTPIGQGFRNDALNKAAYTLHCTGKSETEILGILASKAKGDGLEGWEVERTIQSACSAVATPIMTTRNRRVAARDKRLRG